MLNIQIRPIVTWPGKENANPKDSPFRSTYSQTLDLLQNELSRIKAVENSLVLEMWIDARNIRLDGQLRAGASPHKPGVIFRFTRKTNQRYSNERFCWIYTPQHVSYPCDAFSSWKDNLRAIALSMERLRSVERYGVFKYDEIVSRLSLPDAGGKMSTKDSAAAFMATHSGVNREEILFSDTARAQAYRKAAMKLHPDQGGNVEEFQMLQEANKTLAAAGGGQ